MRMLGILGEKLSAPYGMPSTELPEQQKLFSCISGGCCSQEEMHSRAVDEEGTKLQDIKTKWNNHLSIRNSFIPSQVLYEHFHEVHDLE
ncbi:STT3 oligosaccharyltransferase complex catalytic subunit B [Phyllostomus discolor]|uniref:STT3 oligosaccharyltransferase complex catalytic subunit B n=1 Tax=Phyllostomus discolor TaxID=89673 RepID=A0A833ZRH5_9CHIR|nr:STT3 oligosaccharyltransferase complex catalytic subunit B [Phyllostomus discolor]